MAAPLCYSILQAPRYRIYSVSRLWRNSHTALGNISCFQYFRSKFSGLQQSPNKRWMRTYASTKAEGRSRNTRKGKPLTIPHELLDESVSSGIGSSLREPVTNCFDIQQKIVANDSCKLVSVLTFDIETTGFSRENDRIIEIALQDLEGGHNSTFQTLVNPDCYIPNTHIHGISNHMVSKPDVPRMQELAPILVEYITSRQKRGGCVMLVGHNARSFDVPFLISEFRRCAVDIPPNWLFLDTLPLARQLLKSEGAKQNSKAKLSALVEMFNIPPCGTAHRAMSDVKSLSLVFQQLTIHLKLSMPCLLKQSFKPSDLAAPKKRNV